ncbi:MAG: histidine kinase [Actinomycetota bacterium]
MDALRSVLDWFRRHPRVADAAVMVVVAAIAIPFSIAAPLDDGERELGGLGYALLFGMHLPVVWRRTAPAAALWATVALTVPYWVLDYPDESTGPALILLVYSLATHGTPPSWIRHSIVALTLMTGVLVAGVLSDEDDVPWFAIPANLTFFLAVIILGVYLRTRRQYLAELEAKAARTEEQQAAEARRAVAEERTRIARELHDVVAHSMSVMVVQAGAARRVLDADPSQAGDALQAIEDTGRESLHEMRRVLGVLRGEDDEAQLAPAPGLDDFDRLLQHCEEAGMPVDLVVTGSVRRLSPGLEMNAYRVVQESLTNSLKHAGPASATVTLHYDTDQLRVSVADNGRGATAATAGAGQGIVGMRERVEAYGGDLHAGPRAGGGFGVDASFLIGIDG